MPQLTTAGRSTADTRYRLAAPVPNGDPGRLSTTFLRALTPFPAGEPDVAAAGWGEKTVAHRHPYSYRVVLLVCFLCVEMTVLPVRSASAQSTGSDPQLTPTSPAYAEQEPSIAAKPAAAPTKAPTATVSPSGALGYSFAIDLPPGRNGAAPSLALSYSSDALQEVSPFGAGWSLPISSIRRNTRFGTPPITKNGNTYAYDNAGSDGVPRFERDGSELVVDVEPCPVPSKTCVPSPVPDTRGVVYRDRIDFGHTKSIYNAAGDYWLVIDADGNQRYYGHVPDGSLAAATIADDLGTSQWGLVRSIDPFGNTVEYTYVAQPARASLAAPQLRLLPDTIRYGANSNTGAAHFASVGFSYKVQSAPLALDHLHGHTYLDRLIDSITVSITLPPSGTIAVRSYSFSVVQSSATAHYLLQSIQQTASGITAPKTTFTYSSNSYSPVKPWLAPNATLAAALPSPAFRNFVDGWPVSTGSRRTDMGDLVAGGKRDLTPAQRAALVSGEVASKGPGLYGEITNLQHAKTIGATPEAIVATRPFCSYCIEGIEESGGELMNSRTAVWPKK